jgi:O-antigen/teichoic acid export membrane protein
VSNQPAAAPRLWLSAATNWLAFAAQLIAAFFLAPLVVRALGDERFGLWALVESILAYFTLLDLGVAAFLVRAVARHRARGESDQLNCVCSCGMAVFAVVSALAVLAGLAALPWALPHLTDKLDGRGPALAFAGLLLLNLGLSLPLSVFSAVIDGLERYAVKSAVRVGFVLVRIAGTLAVVWSWPSLVGVALVQTVCVLGENAVLALLAFRFQPGLRFSPRLIDRETLRQVRGFSGDAFLLLLAGRVSFQTAALVIGAVHPVAFITYFALASRPVELAKGLLRQVTATLTPAVSALEAKGDLAAVARVFLGSSRVVLYLVLPVHLGLLFYGREFLTLWLRDPAYGAHCNPSLAILGAGLSLAILQSVGSRVLYGLGRLRLFARVSLAEAGLNLALSVALVAPFGIEGVAVATALPNAVACAFVAAYSAWLLGVGWREYLGGALARPLLAAGPLALFWLAAKAYWPVGGWFDLVTALAAGVLVFAAVALVWERDVRARVTAKVRLAASAASGQAPAALAAKRVTSRFARLIPRGSRRG